MLRRIAPHALWIATAAGRLLPSSADPDLWGHLLFGTLLLSGRLPAHNSFAYTAPEHPWVNHEILAEASMAATFNWLGAPGLVLMKAAIGLATLLLVWRTALARSRSPSASALATVMAAVVMTPGLMIRPQMFTLLFLALTLAILTGEGYRPRRRAWLIPPLFVLWINTHGGVLAGAGLAAVGVLGEFALRIRRNETDRRDLIRTGGFLTALTLALLVNPYGPTLLRFLTHDVTPHVPITEWAPVSLGDFSFAGFKLMLLAVAAGVVWLGGGRLSETLVVAVAAGAALTHRRHIPLFAIAAAPVLAAILVRLWSVVLRRLPRASRSDVRSAGVRLFAGVAAVQVAVAVVAAGHTRGRIVVDPRTYPVQAMRFLAENGITGNVALPFRWGEYALWALPAGTRVAVDGRFTTAYPSTLLADAWRFMSGEPGWNALLTDYPTDVVVADRAQAPALLLRGHSEWEYVYSDPVSVVFVRRVPSQARTLERFRTRMLTYNTAPLDLEFPAGRPRWSATALSAADAPTRVAMRRPSTDGRPGESR